MLKNLNDKLKLMRATRENCEELAMTMGFLEGGAIKTLRSHLRKYYDDHENDTLRNNVDQEIAALIELAEKNRKNEDIINQVGIGLNGEVEEEHKGEEVDSSGQFAHLNWL